MSKRQVMMLISITANVEYMSRFFYGLYTLLPTVRNY
jgi:hypothetical protein